jgi:myo-inositol-1(or 4)-monophosphatase
MNLEALCEEVVRATERIGHEVWLRSQALHSVRISEKSAGDVATDVDLWAEQALRGALLVLLEGSHWWGEETGGGLSAAPTWIVDPIDGTANFARGYPQWSVSVALAVDGQPVLGVILDPHREELFYASQGHGAWLKNRHGLQRMACARESQALKGLAATVFPKPTSDLMARYLPQLARALVGFGQVRRSGSMALELAYLAAGRVDAFWEHGMQAWDAAAALVLLQEAGGQTIAMDDLHLLESRYLAAASPAMMPALLGILRSDAI